MNASTEPHPTGGRRRAVRRSTGVLLAAVVVALAASACTPVTDPVLTNANPVAMYNGDWYTDLYLDPDFTPGEGWYARTDRCGRSTSVEFLLADGWEWFSAEALAPPSNPSHITVRYSVIADGVERASGYVHQGDSELVAAYLGGAKHLTLEMHQACYPGPSEEAAFTFRHPFLHD